MVDFLNQDTQEFLKTINRLMFFHFFQTQKKIVLILLRQQACLKIIYDYLYLAIHPKPNI